MTKNKRENLIDSLNLQNVLQIVSSPHFRLIGVLSDNKQSTHLESSKSVRVLWTDPPNGRACKCTKTLKMSQKRNLLSEK